MKTENIISNWNKIGFNFFLWHDPPGKNWPPVLHPVDEIVMLLEGELTFCINGEKIKLTPGKEYLINAGVRHTVHNTGKKTNRWCYGYRQN